MVQVIARNTTRNREEDDSDGPVRSTNALLVLLRLLQSRGGIPEGVTVEQMFAQLSGEIMSDSADDDDADGHDGEGDDGEGDGDDDEDDEDEDDEEDDEEDNDEDDEEDQEDDEDEEDDAAASPLNTGGVAPSPKLQ